MQDPDDSDPDERDPAGAENPGPGPVTERGTMKSGVRDVVAELRWAFAYLHATAPRLLLVFGGVFGLSTVFPAAIALSVRGLVNVVEAGVAGDPSYSRATVYGWLALGFVSTAGVILTGSLGRYLSRRNEVELGARIHVEVLDVAASMPCSRLESTEFQEDLHRAQSRPEAHMAEAIWQAVDLLTRGVQSVSLLVILGAIEPSLLVLLVPVAVPYLLFQWRLSYRSFSDMDAQVEKRRWLASYTGLLGSGEPAAELKLYGLGPLLLRRVRGLQEQLRALMLRILRVELVGDLLFSLASLAVIYVAITRTAFGAVEGSLTLGDLAIFGTTAAQLRTLVSRCIELMGLLRWESLHVRALRRFLVEGPERAERAPEVARPLELSGGVEFRDVTFTYPGSERSALSDVSFSVASGETIALVGENGAGKTTVARLIAHLYEPDRGAVLYDGVEGRELDAEVVRRQISAVFQHFARYDATVADNVAFGDWRRLVDDREATEEVVRRAGLEELVRSLPDGYDTVLGRALGRTEPSGGQWQQLAVARAMARDARILILDEPTAHLDVQAELQLFERFRALAAGRTTVLISHRFSTVRMADRILVLEEGQLVESGSHEELLQRGGPYAALYDLHWRAGQVGLA